MILLLRKRFDIINITNKLCLDKVIREMQIDFGDLAHRTPAIGCIVLQQCCAIAYVTETVGVLLLHFQSGNPLIGTENNRERGGNRCLSSLKSHL